MSLSFQQAYLQRAASHCWGNSPTPPERGVPSGLSAALRLALGGNPSGRSLLRLGSRSPLQRSKGDAMQTRRWTWIAAMLLAGCGMAAAAPKPPVPGNRLITDRSVGPVRIGMKLSEARRLLPGSVLQRQFDGDGLPWVAILQNDEVLMLVLADDPGADRNGSLAEDLRHPARLLTTENRIDATHPIDVIQVFHPAFRTAEGVGPETPLQDVEQKYGKLRRIEWSEVEQREFAYFSHQPKHLQFRVDGGSAGEAGLYGKRKGATAVTRRYTPSARVLSVTVSQ
jgi:hypothetical protein